MSSDTLFSPESCHSSVRIREFLRLSRLATDDAVKRRLNSVKSNSDCDKYFRETIGPEWKARQELIKYCFDYSKRLREKTVEEQAAIKSGESDSPIVDLRVDPYALKSYEQGIEQRFLQCDLIDNWVKNESTIESILHEQTVEVLNDKCYYTDWLLKFRNFRP